MNCEWVGDKHSAYLDGELSVSDELEVQNHVCACENCRCQLDHFAAIGGLLRCCEADEVVLPAWESFESKLDQTAPK